MPTKRAWDETTPDGTPIMNIGLAPVLRLLTGQRTQRPAPPAEEPDTPPLVIDPRAADVATAGQAGMTPRDFEMSSGSSDAPPPAAGATPTIGAASEQQFDIAPPIKLTPPPSAPAVIPLTPRERYQQEYDQLAADEHPKDTNGRFKSMLLNALYNVGQRADALLSTGRPVDEYGIASLAGEGIGSAVAGAVRPDLDENRKRDARMQHLGTLIQQQLAIEKQQSATENDRRELDLKDKEIKQKGELGRLGIVARSRPKPYTVAGHHIDFRWNEKLNDGDGGWEAYEPEVNGAPIVDTSKTPDDNGLTPKMRADIERWRADRTSRETIAGGHDQTQVKTTELGIKSREKEGAANRKSHEGIAAANRASADARAAAGNASREGVAAANRQAAGRRASIQSLARYAAAKQRNNPAYTLDDAVKEAKDMGVDVYDEDEKK